MRFVVIAAPRSGSTFIERFLHAQDDIFCNGEVFHRKKAYLSWPERDLTETVQAELETLRAKPKQLIERVYSMSYGRAHVGFKLLLYHAPEALDALVADPNVKKVLLFRQNAMASYASDRVANETQTWQIEAGKKLPSIPKVRFDEKDFQRFWRRRSNAYRRVAKKLTDSGQPFHMIHYEEISEPVFLASLLCFIGANAGTARYNAPLQKIGSTDVVSRFANPDEVLHFLSSNDLLHWTHEATTVLPKWLRAPTEGSAQRTGTLRAPAA